jgi:glycosyltransferase involved in cell wall biosynthesis
MLPKMVSVIIRTHNPRKEYLSRVLDGLRSQTLPIDGWELLLIDNASLNPVAQLWDISWHPYAKHVREEKAGSAHAYLCGIRESHGDLLIFVDDDNILSNDYLSAAVRLSQTHPYIGAFGGTAKGEFEVPPPAWMKSHLGVFGIEELKRDYWSNFPYSSQSMPIGAGLCVRRVVAEDYARKVQANPLRSALGRIGTGLGACEDIDLALCAVDLGMGTGRFQALHFTHLIPRRRITKDYVVRVVAGANASGEILQSFRAGNGLPKPRYQLVRLAWRMLRGPDVDRRMAIETRRARKKARAFLSGGQTSLQL